MSQRKTEFVSKLRSFFSKLPFDINGKCLCVCLSGGADSVALLRGMIELSEELNVNIKACHFNHGIRGEEADRDEEFCKELCKSLDIEIYCGRDDVPAYAALKKMSLEEAARDRRYAFFKRIYSKKKVDYCLTAHNMNDDAETLIFNLIRGTGPNGAAAIAPYNSNIIRPLLKITRQEIEEYLESIGQNHINDSTNETDEYTRNYIRHVIIPSMQRVNPCVVEALGRYTEACRTDRRYFSELVNQNYDADLRKLHKSVRDRWLLDRALTVLKIHLNSDMLESLERALFAGRRKIVPLTSNGEAIVCKGKVEFVRKIDDTEFDYPTEPLLSGENKYFGGRVTLSCKEISPQKENINKISTTNVITFDNIKGSVCVRNRRIGDKICIRGINRSLKKLFIDKKIPKEYRHIVPIIFDDEGILYVPFIGIADRAFPSQNSQRVQIVTALDNVQKERWTDAYEK